MNYLENCLKNDNDIVQNEGIIPNLYGIKLSIFDLKLESVIE